MSPVVGVLVAMVLMAMLGGLVATCGVIAGAVAFAPSENAMTLGATAQAAPSDGNDEHAENAR